MFRLDWAKSIYPNRSDNSKGFKDFVAAAFETLVSLIKNGGSPMVQQKYENIMVAVDGSHEAELAFEKGVNVALRNGSRLTIAHVIDTRALQSISTFDGWFCCNRAMPSRWLC